jgi:hypothetical protein
MGTLSPPNFSWFSVPQTHGLVHFPHVAVVVAKTLTMVYVGAHMDAAAALALLLFCHCRLPAGGVQGESATVTVHFNIYEWSLARCARVCMYVCVCLLSARM